MTFLSKVFGCFSFLTRRHSSGQYSKSNQECSSIQEEPIQRPPEDTDVEEKMGYEDSLDEMEILPDFSTAAEPVLIQVEEPEYQTPLTIFPRSSTTVAKPLLIQVAPLHPLPDEVETGPSFFTVDEPLMAQFKEPEKETPPDEQKKMPCSSIKVAGTLMVQEATWHLTLPAEEEILSVAEPVMVQMVPAQVEQERPPERRGRRRTKNFLSAEEEILPSVAEPVMVYMASAQVEQERPPERRGRRRTKNFLSAEEEILPSVAEPVMVQMVPAQVEQERPPERRGRRRTKNFLSAEEEILPSVAEPVMVQMVPAQVEQERPPERRGRRRTKKERKTVSSKCPDATPPPAKPKLAWMDSPMSMEKVREVEDETPEKKETDSVEMIVELDRKRMKKERKTEYATPPPAKVKLAWMEMDNTKVTHMKKREDEKERLERQANKIEDTKTEQTANITPPPAKGKRMNVQESECSSKIRQQSSRRWKGFHLFHKLAEKKSAAEKEKKETRKEEKIQRKLLHEKYVNDPSMKHQLINKYNNSYCCGLILFV
ncbi:golgin subfamily A member 6-like protein 26 [Chanodichthys erythropterus]|uniref:golgin subfamily A member 6-like protein 26 n=1 Tax=Chanodichthys erythropterus TaxID=933992 RepID=UPI00351E51FC